MNVRLLATFLCLASIGTGCIIHDDDYYGGGGGGGTCCNTPPAGQPGHVTFNWTFAGGFCRDVPDVRTVHIIIPGESLATDGYYPCNANGFDGIVLHDFAARSYTFTIEGLDTSNRVVYQATGSFVVNGNTRVTVDLTPVGSPGSYAYISWLFPANASGARPSCSQAGVSRVDARIDGGEWVQLSCAEGQSGGVATPYLSPGTHTLELVAVGANGQPYYYSYGSFDTVSGRARDYTFSFWAVGGAAVRWEFRNGNVALDCNQAGVTQVFINFYDTLTGQYLYGTQGDVHGCNAAPVVYSFLPPGDYYVEMQASGPGGVYQTVAQSLFYRVEAFVQKGPADAVTALLYRR